MTPQFIPWLLPTISLLFLSQAHIGSTRIDEFYHSCGNTFTCGNTISNINYPFRSLYDPSYCGYPGFVLTCNNQTNITNINILSTNFRVLEIDQGTQTMRIAREDVMGDGITCPTEMMNTTLDYSVFDYAGAYINYTFFYGCPDFKYPNWYNISCGDNHGAYVMPGEHGPELCNASVVIPGPVNSGNGGSGPLNAIELGGILKQGFMIRWKVGDHACSVCTTTKGRCGYTNQTVCFCTNSPYVSNACPMDYGTSPIPSEFSPPGPNLNSGTTSNYHSNSKRNIAFYIVGALLGGVGLGWLIFFCLQRRKLRRFASSNSLTQMIAKDIPPSHLSKDLTLSIPSNNLTKSSSYQSSKSIFGNGMSYFGVHVFNYAELEQATNNFDSSRELGDGGFGTVYYGVLPDGRMVAVKRLYEHCFKRVEQFMNEVEILTRLRHKNLVSLYGCTSRRSRELLLVYEYVQNGTVADHLHGRQAKSSLLSWPIRLNIAIETANALAYLHGSDIIHRDVKTNNILLDVGFHVKVADFGLSRLFPSDVTHVSTAPQGTPGYVDPEYYQCYQLTEKSDVYSFGVVLIELISSLQAVDTSRNRDDINLSSMAINKILNHNLHELVDSSLGFETNSIVRRTVTLVAELAFRCLQQEKDMRPSMEEVVEVLKGIQNDKWNADKAEIVDMMMDEDAVLLRAPLSPDSAVADSIV